MSLEQTAFGSVVAATATIPFEFTKTWFPVDWLEVSRVFMAIAIGLTGLLVLRDRTGLPRNWLVASSGLLIAVAIGSVVAFPTSAGAKDLAALIAYSAFALAVAWNVRSLARLRIIAIAVVASVVVVAVVAIAEEALDINLWRDTGFGVIDRRNSTLADPNITARVLLIGFAVLAGLTAASSMSRRMLVSATLAAAVIGIGEALAQSRTLWVLSLLVAVFLVVTVLRRLTDFLIVGAFVAALVISIAVIPATANRADPLELGGTGSAMTTNPALPDGGILTGPPTPVDSLLARLPLDGVRRYLIRAGVAMWMDHPIVGVGLGGFDTAMRGPYWAYMPLDRRSVPVTLSHTDGVRVAAETGIVGLFAWVLFLAAYLGRCLLTATKGRLGRIIGMTLMCTFGITFLASQLAGRFTTEPYLWVMAGVLSSAPLIVGELRPAPASTSGLAKATPSAIPASNPSIDSGRV